MLTSTEVFNYNLKTMLLRSLLHGTSYTYFANVKRKL